METLIWSEILGYIPKDNYKICIMLQSNKYTTKNIRKNIKTFLQSLTMNINL